MFTKECKSCHRITEYKNAESLRKSMHYEKCRKCCNDGRVLPEETKQKIGQSSKGRNVGSKNFMYGKTHTDEVKKKISDMNKGKLSGDKHPFYGKENKWGTHTNETKQKLRELRLGKVTPNYNPTACQIIEQYGKEHGYNFQHAENGGEVKVIGYSLDGYDKEKNVVIEFDEPKHLRKKQKEKDTKRQKEIEDFLKCTFIRINS